MIHIDLQKCNNCGSCIDVCPMLVIKRRKEGPYYAHEDSCIRCYHCVAICPQDAIQCSEYPFEKFIKVDTLKAASSKELDALLLQRRSIREFRNKEIPRDLLEELLNAASHAPTGHNLQEVELCVITNKSMIEQLDGRVFQLCDILGSIVDFAMPEIIGSLLITHKALKMLRGDINTYKRFKEIKGKSNMVFKGAPAIIIAHCDLKAVTGKDDCVIALSHMMMAANSRGIGATWLAMFVGAAMIDPSLKLLLNIPLVNVVHAAMILGFPKYQYKRIIPRKLSAVKWIE